MTKQEQIEKLTEVIRKVQMENFRQSRNTYTSAEQIAEVLYNAGYRKIDVTNNVLDDAIDVSNNVLDDAIDATFRGAVLRLAEKLKQRTYCDNCFRDGKWHRYVFIEDIDDTAQKFLTCET